MKAALTFILTFFFFTLSAQHHRNHARKLHHHTRIVTDKQYGQKPDSSFFSAEVFFGNTNSWTGDDYGLTPSLQFLFTYDNDRNTSFGIFGAFNQNGFNGGFSNGADLFYSRQLNKKCSAVFDCYTYFNRHDSLESTLGYHAKIYNLYTARLKYDLNKKFSLIGSYSVFNNADSLQQFVSLEMDYNLFDELTLVTVYSTGTHLFNLSEGTFAAGAGFSATIRKITIDVIYSPLFFSDVSIPSYSTFMFTVSTDLVKLFKKNTARFPAVN